MLRDLKDAVQQKREANKEAQRRLYTCLIIQYTGDKTWRVGMVPKDGGLADWAEGLPWPQALEALNTLKKDVVRVDYGDRHGA